MSKQYSEKRTESKKKAAKHLLVGSRKGSRLFPFYYPAPETSKVLTEKWQREIAADARTTGHIVLEHLIYILAADKQYIQTLPGLWAKYQCGLRGPKVLKVATARERIGPWLALLERWGHGRVGAVKGGLRPMPYMVLNSLDKEEGSYQRYDGSKLCQGPEYVKLEELKEYLNEAIKIPLPALLYSNPSQSEKKSADKEPFRDTETTEKAESSVGDMKCIFQLKGEFWLIRFKGKETRLADKKGLKIITYLLECPNRPFNVYMLDRLDNDQGIDENSNRLTKRQIEKESLSLAKLNVENLTKEDVEKFDNLAHKFWGEYQSATSEAKPEARRRWEEFMAYLLKEHGIKVVGTTNGVKIRKTTRRDRDFERARQNVKKRIDDAIKRIEKDLPALAEHLRRYIRTGGQCSYDPVLDSAHVWEIYRY